MTHDGRRVWAATGARLVARDIATIGDVADMTMEELTESFGKSYAQFLHEASHAWFNGALLADRWSNEAFASDYGTQAILARPIDKGFNRLAWIFPYLVGISGAFAAVVLARRWSRRPATDAAPVTTPQSDDLRARLDDELRDLD